METVNKGKPLGVFAYEFLGTAFIMYALMMQYGQFTQNVAIISFGCMLQAWSVSGGHFNPALTIGMFVAEKKVKNIVVAGTMIVAQFAGAFFGILLGFLSLIDDNGQNKKMEALQLGDKADAKVPYAWVGHVIPYTIGGPDWGNTTDGWTRNWQTFWGLFISTIFLTVCFISIKNKETQLTDNLLFQALSIALLLWAVALMNADFGSVGFNPALATAYIIFEESQLLSQPNLNTFKSQVSISLASQADHPTYLNHYLWAYLFAPMVGGFIGGIFYLIHAKCTAKKGSDNDKEELMEPLTESFEK